MIIYAIYRLINLILSLFDLALLIYVALSWIRPTANRWTELLRRIVEPVLTPIRRFLVAKLPGRWMMVDWSPIVAWVLIGLIRRVLMMVLGMFIGW